MNYVTSRHHEAVSTFGPGRHAQHEPALALAPGHRVEHRVAPAQGKYSGFPCVNDILMSVSHHTINQLDKPPPTVVLSAREL